jgi:putative endopeptidase
MKFIWIFCLAAIHVSAQTNLYSELNKKNFDSSVNPADDFYRFVNGKWIDHYELKPSEIGITATLAVREKTTQDLYHLLQLLKSGSLPSNEVSAILRTFYLAGLDTVSIERLKITPITSFLEAIDNINDKKQLMAFVGEQQRLLNNLLFNFFVLPDAKAPKVYLPIIYQGGIGLPNSDDYYSNDQSISVVSSKYLQYLTKLFINAGYDMLKSERDAVSVFELEKQIAAGHFSNVENGNADNVYHKMSVVELIKLYPHMEWKVLLDNMKIDPLSINISQPRFLKHLDSLLDVITIDRWKTYIKAHLISYYAPYLSKTLQQLHFDFYSTVLMGRTEMPVRNEIVQRQIEELLPDPLGQLYVQTYFNSSSIKAEITKLTNNLIKAFAIRLKKVDWLSKETLNKAIEKLAHLKAKIAYPDHWRDYKNLKLSTSYFTNLLAIFKNEWGYQTNKLKLPVDKNEWAISPYTINAYYNAITNEIVFPIAYFQPPFFDQQADDALNYSGIGSIIGHEIIHGFDLNGARFDRFGKLNNWWSAGDNNKYLEKSNKLVSLYNSFTMLDSLHVNGELSINENIADLGGLLIAYDAYKLTDQGKTNTLIDDLTGDQRFFINYARRYRAKLRPEAIRNLMTDNHAPLLWRVNGALMNCPPFYKIFNVQRFNKLWISDAYRVSIW